MKRKIYILAFLFLVSVVCVYPQESVTINEYGIYFINEGEAIKLPIEDQISAAIFWRNYIIFTYGNCIIYNIENGAMSNLLLTRGNGALFPLESNNDNIIIYVGGNEYELDPITLQTLNSKINTNRTYDERPNDYDVGNHNLADLVYIDEKHQRLQGNNFYLNVILADDIDYRKITLCYGGTVNQFLFIIDDRYNGEH